MNFLKQFISNLMAFIIGCLLTCVAAGIMAVVVAEAAKNSPGSAVILWSAYAVGVLFMIMHAISRLFRTHD